MIYETERLILRTLENNHKDLLMLSNYFKINEKFLERWEPKRDEKFYSYENMKDMVSKEKELNLKKEGLSLYIFKKDNEKRIIGSIKLNNIVYGVFLSCFLGYRLDHEEINKGYMTEAAKKMIDIAFNDYKLHRIEGNIIPENIASIKVVEKLGFAFEGTSPKYLKINGKTICTMLF